MDGYSEADGYGNSKIWRQMRSGQKSEVFIKYETKVTSRVVVSEELLILASCLLRPMSRNAVLQEFSVRRFAVIQEEIRSRAS